MKLIEKKLILPFDGRPVFPGFITYISNEQPILLHRYGYVDASDTYDDFGDQISHDNGQTWSRRILRQSSIITEGGKQRWIENASFYDADTGKVLAFTSKRIFREDETPETKCSFWVEVTEYDPIEDKWNVLNETTLGLENLMISFCRPIKTRSGKLLVPAFTIPVLPSGQAIIHPQLHTYDLHSAVMIGNYNDDGQLEWHLSEQIVGDINKTSRGVAEPMIVQLDDDRIAMILRGSNVNLKNVIGCKWVSFSSDDGQTWTTPEPLKYTNGEIVESGASGGALWRNEINGKLYWIGNPAIDAPTDGNWPRNLLAIFEVCEHPFALRKESMTVIERGEISQRLRRCNIPIFAFIRTVAAGIWSYMFPILAFTKKTGKMRPIGNI